MPCIDTGCPSSRVSSARWRRNANHRRQTRRARAGSKPSGVFLFGTLTSARITACGSADARRAATIHRPAADAKPHARAKRRCRRPRRARAQGRGRSGAAACCTADWSCNRQGSDRSPARRLVRRRPITSTSRRRPGRRTSERSAPVRGERCGPGRGDRVDVLRDDRQEDVSCSELEHSTCNEHDGAGGEDATLRAGASKSATWATPSRRRLIDSAEPANSRRSGIGRRDGDTGGVARLRECVSLATEALNELRRLRDG